MKNRNRELNVVQESYDRINRVISKSDVEIF